MRREQLGELVSLTSQMPTLRRTAEMPLVELNDLLRKDRELDIAPIVTAEHFDVSVRYDTRTCAQRPRELAVGTVQIRLPSSAKLLLGCLAAFAGGFALTIPLWW
jgi:hypothetical protein